MDLTNGLAAFGQTKRILIRAYANRNARVNHKRMKIRLFLQFLVLCFLAGSLKAEPASLQLTLPAMWYGVPGVPVSLYYDNVVLTEKPAEYRFEVSCDIGAPEARRWTVTPEDKDVGDHAMEVIVKDAEGKTVDHAKTMLRVAPGNAGAGRELKLLIVGDSLTAATIYPNEIGRLLSTEGNPRWTMLSDNKPASAGPGVAHEGYGGWRWSSFLTRQVPKPERTPDGKGWKTRNSPFVFPGKDGEPELNIGRYLKEVCGGQSPDVVTFLLGINDCFGANPDNPKLLDQTIDAALDNAEKLLAAFRAASPKTVFAVGLTTPPNSREEAFDANYKGKYHRWGWKRIQHRLVRRMMERLGNREGDGIQLVPTELNLDPVDGFPVNNGVHPSAGGYKEIGASFYAWLKVWMAGTIPAEIPAVTKAMQGAVDQGEVAGAVTLVTSPDKILHLSAVGMADIAAGKSMREDALFWIASMTKPLTASAILMLQDEGKLSVNDPVAKYLPELAALKTADGKPGNLTLKQLLTHTSGMAEASPKQSLAARTLAELIPDYVQPLKFEPGTKWQYCQSGINSLGRIIEIVSGKSLPDFFQERLLGPLGMKDTAFFPSPEQLVRLAKTYELVNGKLEEAPLNPIADPARPERFPAANGGLFSTARDYARFCQMLLNRGALDGRRFLSPEAVAQMSALQTGDIHTGFTEGNGWGLGCCVVRQPQGVTAMLSPGAFGHGGAYGTQAWIDPVKQRIFILMVQRANFANGDASEVRRAFQAAAVGALDGEVGK
jgi:CubicO group peptidase (beta-lactamase class C family)